MSELDLEEQYKVISGYYERVILGYVRNDIVSLLNPELDQKQIGGCSVPLAMSVLSTMNQLGCLTSNKTVKEKRTEYYTRKFCSDYMSKIDKLYAKETFQKFLVHFYRHAMAHQFMPKHLVGITRDQKQNNLLEFGSGEIYCSIQVKILAETLIEAIDLVYEKLNRAIENDHEFIRRFYRHLIDQIEEHKDKNAELKNSVDDVLKTNEKELSDFTTTTVSGTDTSVTA